MNPLPILIPLCLFTAASLLAGCGGERQATPMGEEPTAEANEQEPASSDGAVHWSYQENGGPAGWGQLSSDYHLCADGMHQSPIDIQSAAVAGEETWSADHGSTSLTVAHTEHVDDIIDNGHTIQVTVDEGSTLRIGGSTYELKQFHFHTPSEHTIDGEHFPMEMHHVYAADDGALAVVGVLFEESGVANQNIAQIVENLPDAAGETNHVADSELELHAHHPDQAAAYHYSGSLTTPPCSENVEWLVLKQLVQVTADQVAAIASRIGPNNRPTQPLNDRTVMSATVAGSTQM